MSSTVCNGDGDGHAMWLIGKNSDIRFGPFFLTMHQKRNDCILFGCGQGRNLLVQNRGDVNGKGGAGPGAQWIPSPSALELFSSISSNNIENIGVIQFASKGREEKGWYLQDLDGTLMGNGRRNSPNTQFYLAPASQEEIDEVLIENQPPILSHAYNLTTFNEDINLTKEEQESFKIDGYLHMKDIVPPSLIENALKIINHHILQPNSIQGKNGKSKSGRTFGDAITMNKEILDLLYESPVWTIVQRLLGKGNAEFHGAPQIALRPPKLRGGTAEISPTAWHTDGMVGNQHSPFTLLVGIALSSQSTPNSGNLVVHPGSHEILQKVYRDNVNNGQPLQWLENDDDDDDNNDANENKNQCSNSDNDAGSEKKRTELPNGKAVLAEPGDIILAHQKTAHQVLDNLSCNIRYQIYFRIRHKKHYQFLESGILLDDLWVEYEGLH